MKESKFKHLSFEDRSTIQDFLNFGYNFTQISNRISKDRTTVAKEVKKHRFLKSKISSSLKPCPKLSSPPYVCNSCLKTTSCKFIKYIYDASIAHNEYLSSLIDTRSNLKISKHQIASINEVVAPLMIHKHHSVNQVYISHPDILPFSKTTFYKYIDLGILNVRNIDLRRKVRFKVKKEREENNEKINKSIRIDRSYRDFKDYLEFHPNASIVEMDTVIGTSGGKGGKCFLTLLFRNFNFMLIYLLPYKRSIHVTEVFNDLKKALGPVEFQRLFEVVLTDNGSEFSDPLSIEIDIDTGQKLTSVFYCDPNCSWQKGSIEKNHEFIRYILPKGSSFASLSQEDCYLIASHINSTPRIILNNQSPFDAAKAFIGENNIKHFNISRIEYDDIILSPRLLRK